MWCQAESIFSGITSQVNPVKDQLIRALLCPTTAKDTNKVLLTVCGVGSKVKVPVVIADVLHLRLVCGRLNAVDILSHIAVQMMGIKEEIFRAAVNSAFAAQAHDKGLAVVRMDCHVVSGRITDIVQLLLRGLEGKKLDDRAFSMIKIRFIYRNPALGVLRQITLVAGFIPVQIGSTVDNSGETFNTCDVLVTVLGMRM